MTTAIFLELGPLFQRPGEQRPLEEVFDAEVGRVEAAWLDHYDEQLGGYRAKLAEQPRERAFADVCAQFDLDADPEQLTEALFEQVVRATTVSGAARESLQRLAANNELGVLTDESPEWTDRLLAEYDLTEQFDSVVTAVAAGARKPASEPFDLARERVPADEYVLVGDDYERDVEGARNAGFVPIHFEAEGPDFWRTLKALV